MTDDTGPGRGGILAPLVLCAALAAVSLPTLHAYQFSNSIENIVVETALETRRDGHWLIPRMLDQPRTRKPPVAAWVTALYPRRQTVTDLSDPQSREAAYARLAREMRFPALGAACLTVLGAVLLGRVLGDPRVGFAAGVITATALLFLREARLATPDTHLALWVTWTNVFLARAVFGGERWLGWCGAAVCLALAVMTKGPVALVLTIAPLLVFLALRVQRPRERAGMLPILVGIAIFLCLSLPWPVMMLSKYPGVWRTWLNEIARVDPADPRPEPWYVNAQIFRFFMPWTVWMSVGLITGVVSVCRRERNPAQLAFWLVLVPLVVMSFFAERKPRYILPVIPAAAVLSAWPLVHVMRGAGPRVLRHVYVVLHWGCVIAIPVAGIVLAAYAWRLPDGTPWIARAVALGLASGLLLLILVAVVVGKRRETPMLIVTAVAMLMFDVVYIHGNSRDARGRSEMKPLADAIVSRAPDARVYSYFPSEPGHNSPPDLSIYLNRVVRPVTSMSEIATEGSVVVVVGARGEPGIGLRVDSGGVVPTDAQYIGSSKRGGVTWRAYAIFPSPR